MLDHEMYLFCSWEKHMRGGTTFLNEQYATANNKYIPGFSPLNHKRKIRCPDVCSARTPLSYVSDDDDDDGFTVFLGARADS